MNNDQEIQNQNSEAMTPPPFRHSEEPHEPQPAASPTLDERIATLGLDEESTGRLRQLAAGIDADALTSDLLNTLARGVTHDSDVENADAAGYLRGRNEKIEAVLHPEPEAPDEAEAVPVFPRYCRRSIWD